jgi:hypothetical protein
MLRVAAYWGPLILLIFWATAAGSKSPEVGRVGFGFCAPPYPPRCVDVPQVYTDAARVSSCEVEITRYTASTLAYRACLLREAERAVLETNSIIDRFKCGIAIKALCPGVMPSPQ